jgi:undecaprenyl-phosphate 4-deoxy-4-formamido-L-arabinose transferase
MAGEQSVKPSDQLPRGVSVVVPVYNSAAILPEFVARLEPVLVSIGFPFELILVNDGSRDGSWGAIGGLVASHPWVRGICLARNHGQHNAVLAGIRAAGYDVTVTMDDDLQHLPEEVPVLLAALTDRFDVIYGPPERERHGLFRDLASVVTKLALQEVMGAETARIACAFRAFRTNLRDSFSACQSPFVIIDILLTWGTNRFGSVRVRHGVRAAGRSNYSFGMLVRHTLNMTTGFSVLPLQLGSIVGFVFTLFGMGVLAFVLGRYFITGSSVAGFPFLASIIAIFSGAQLFALGIIGEYLAHMHFRLMGKPPYAIRNEIGCRLEGKAGL